MPINRVCFVCKKTFRAPNRRWFFCTGTCYKKALEDETIPIEVLGLHRHKCKVCAKKFLGHANKVYHSDECKKLSTYERKNQEEKRKGKKKNVNKT